MRLRNLWRIAKWEILKNSGGVDRRILAVAIVGLALLGAIAPIAGGGGAVLDEGIYRVGVTDDSPYYAAVAAEDTFAIHPGAGAAELANGEIEVLMRSERIDHAPTSKGRAAREELRDAIRKYNHRQLLGAANRTAAFPVRVTLQYRERTNILDTYRIDSGNDGGTDETADRSGNNDDGPDDTRDGDAGTGRSDADQTDTADTRSDDSGRIGGIGDAFSGEDPPPGSPTAISPPFPFQSLILAFVFVIPLNFLIQAYGSSMLAERLNRRGELLLVAPVSRAEIVGGKTLPYFAGAMVLEGLIATGLTYLTQGTIGGAISLLAITPLVVLFLAATFLGAMFARSYKELTFVTVTITVTLTSYAFIPAIFTDVTPIALISPLTIVVRDLQAETVALGEFLFSSAPPLLSALVLFGLGLGLYREEDMFTQRSIPLKLLDALAGPIRRRWHVGVLTAVLLPFVFVLELLAIAVLFPLGDLAIPFVLVTVAVIEELAKSLPIYAAYAHDRFDRGVGTALVLGTASGVGFFIAEKLTLVAQLVGLPKLQVGQAGLQIGVLSGLAIVIAPLALHVATAAIAALGARWNRRRYTVGLGLAILVHISYNYTVVSALG